MEISNLIKEMILDNMDCISFTEVEDGLEFNWDLDNSSPEVGILRETYHWGERGTFYMSKKEMLMTEEEFRLL
jgi:hypothetical protein